VPQRRQRQGKTPTKNFLRFVARNPLKSLDSDEIVRYLRKINGLA
jgi:hypothetical protein